MSNQKKKTWHWEHKKQLCRRQDEEHSSKNDLLWGNQEAFL
jgi:hypothetical protein